MRHKIIKMQCIKIPETTPIFFSKEDFQRFMDAVGNHWMKDSFLFAVMTGMRRGEVLNLKWSDVNWERKQLTIGSDGETKNRTARRVDFNPPLEAHLEAMRTRRAPDSDWIFPSPQRGDRDIRVREAAELPAFGFHDCRHFLCSYCVMSGIDYMTTAQWAGHRDGGILIGKVYGHLADEHTKAQAAKLVFTPPATRTNKESRWHANELIPSACPSWRPIEVLRPRDRSRSGVRA